MNQKRAKEIRRRADAIILMWLKGILGEEESKEITMNNLSLYLPDEKYFHAQGQRRLYYMSPKWVQKQLKKGKSVSDILKDTNNY